MDYWKIPKAGGDISDLLSAGGYSLGKHYDQKKQGISLIFPRGSTTIVGILTRDDAGEASYKVTYCNSDTPMADLPMIRSSVTLATLLSSNGIPFTNEPSIETVMACLNERRDFLNRLVDDLRNIPQDSPAS